MVFTKQSSHKTNSKGHGRPRKDPDETMAAKTQEEMREYWREKQETHRGTTTRSQSADTVPPSRSSSPEPKRGRPPLGDMAMTPRTLSARKRETMRRKYKESEVHQRHVSKVRSRSVSGRWCMKIADGEGSSRNTGDIDAELDSSETSDLDQEDQTDEVASEHEFLKRKLKLKMLISDNPLENVDFFVHYLRSTIKPSKLNLSTVNYSSQSPLTDRQIRYTGDMFIKVMNTDDGTVDKLIKYWLHHLLSNKIVKAVFDENQWDVPDEYLTTEHLLYKVANSLESKYMKRDRTSNEQRKLGTLYVVDVAQTAHLDINDRGSVSLLAKYTSCSWRFAKSVLLAIKNGTVEELLVRNTRCDSIHANTLWTDRIVEFVLRPDNSRACPGQEKVSIKYGVRRPKFLLRRSRHAIATAFLTEYPDCPFRASTIIREFPQNAVTATARDRQRNSCPYHCNARRLINALHKADIATNVSSSCRGMVWSTMCNDETIDHDDPTQWNADCVYRICKNCPTLKIDIPTEKKKQIITYSQWKYGFDQKKKDKQLKKNPNKKDAGKVFGLFNVTETIEAAVENFLALLPKMRSHIYTAYCQWNAHAVNRVNLDGFSIITIEDYQQNLEIVLMENPTSTAYSTNKVTIALYPICVEYKIDNVLHKGAVVFLSDDKKHDLQQVASFEKRMFEIVRSLIPHPVLKWQRWTDGCGEQFRSRFCNSDCLKANEKFGLEKSSWEYFEAHEGKNTSDTIGSLIKCAFLRAIVNHPGEIRCAKDVVNLLSIMPESTEKFSFFVVEEFPEINRIPSEKREEIVIKNILSMHSLKNINGTLFAQKLTCTECTPSTFCEDCVKFNPSTINPSSDIVIETVEPLELIEQTKRIHDDDIGLSDDDSDLDEIFHDENSANFRPGDVVWARHQKIWYPAKIAGRADLPVSLKRKLQKSSANLVPVLWYGKDKHSLIPIRFIDHLSQNRVDESRASVSEDILVKYNEALSDLRND